MLDYLQSTEHETMNALRNMMNKEFEQLQIQVTRALSLRTDIRAYTTLMVRMADGRAYPMEHLAQITQKAYYVNVQLCKTGVTYLFLYNSSR